MLLCVFCNFRTLLAVKIVGLTYLYSKFLKGHMCTNTCATWTDTKILDSVVSLPRELFLSHSKLRFNKSDPRNDYFFRIHKHMIVLDRTCLINFSNLNLLRFILDKNLSKFKKYANMC